MNNIVVIAPHADDEVLGCGATIAKHVAQGDKVWVIVATNANVGAPEMFDAESIETVRREAENSHKVLGVEKTVFLEFPAPALDAFPSYKISLEISKVLSQVKPTHLYLPHPGDIHLDHAAIYRASLVAARPQGDYVIDNIYCYETLSETEWFPLHGDNAFVPNHFVDVSSDFFDKKIEAMKCFSSQLRDFPHPRSLKALEVLSQFRGATIGVINAEAFEVERQIAR